MNAPARLATFVAVLAAVFLAAWGVGSALGTDPPGGSAEPAATDHHAKGSGGDR